MMTTLFMQGVSRVLNCPKVHVAVSGLVSTWFAVRYATGDLPPTQRSALWIAFIGAVTVVLREIINAWTEEDVARQGTQGDCAGANRVQVNGSRQPLADPAAAVRNLPSQQLAAPPDLPIRPYPTISPAPPSPSTNARSAPMPARTKLPLIMVASALITLLMLSGCQTCPELAIYREGLHQVDEPLYQAHLLLLNDAVKANLRTDADRQIVQQGIDAARGLYAESKKDDAAGAAPATQP